MACPSSRKLSPCGGGSSSSSSTRATSRWRKWPAEWYHSRSQCVWATTSTRRGGDMRGVCAARAGRTRRQTQRAGRARRPPRARTPEPSLDDGAASRDEPVHDHDQREYEQQVNEPAADVEGERAECPQDEQDDRKCEEHGVHPRVRVNC